MVNLLEIKDKVQRYLSEIVHRYEVDGEGTYSVRVGSSRVFVRILELEKSEKTLLLIQAPVLFEIPLTPDLYKYVALHTDDYMFGHLSLSEDEGLGMVMFSHTLLADYLDLDELGMALGAVASTADQIDDELQHQFGGRRFHEEE